MSPKISRRTLLKTVLAAGIAGMVPPIRAADPPSQSAQKVLDKLFGHAVITPTDRIAIEIVDLAEDGAVVPIQVRAQLECVESVSFIAEKNPTPLIGAFELGPNVLPAIATRIKLAESCHVIAVVKAQGRLYSVSKYVRVIKGGC